MSKVEHGYTVTPHTHASPDERNLQAPLLQLDLTRELAELRGGEALRTHGHAAKTLAKYADLRIVLLAFEQGARMEEHQTKGRVSVHVIEGRVVFKLGEQAVELTGGGLLQIAPHVAHDVEALAPSAVLLTIAWPAAEAGTSAT